MLRQVSTTDPYVDDRHAKRLRFSKRLVANPHHQRAALLGEDHVRRYRAQHPAQLVVQDRAQTVFTGFLRLNRFAEPLRVADPVPGKRVYEQAAVVERSDLQRRCLKRQNPLFIDYDGVDRSGIFELEPRLADHALDLA